MLLAKDDAFCKYLRYLFSVVISEPVSSQRLVGRCRRQSQKANEIRSLYIRKRAFTYRSLLVDLLVCVFDACLISRSTTSNHAV